MLLIPCGYLGSLLLHAGRVRQSGLSVGVSLAIDVRPPLSAA